MKVFLILFISLPAYSNVTYVGEDIMINGLRVSARKHWNFQPGITPDVLFCKHLYHSGAKKSDTIIKKVPPQKMTFFTAEPLPQSSDRITERDNETLLLEQVTCNE